MKHKHSAGFIFFISILFFALIFPVRNFFYITPVKAASKLSAQKNYIESEVVAKLSKNADVDLIASKYRLTATLLKTDSNGNLYVLRCSDIKSCVSTTTKKIIKSLQKNPAVVSVQPNFKYKPLSRIPNDRNFSAQWALNDINTTPGGVSAPSAWDFESPKKNKVPIAVIDTGISYSNSEIKDSITSGRAKGRNINSPKKKPIDYDGHGTMLAGVIAAKTNNKKGLAGSSFFGNLKIMPLKFDFTTTQAISAINYAKAKNIPIINASWGGYGEEGLDLVLKDTIASYTGIFVTSAGNGNEATDLGYDHDGGDPTQKMYPCDFELANIICVAASDKNGALTGYSDFGATSVDLAAPGGTDNDLILGLDLKKNKFISADGTSLSTAFVTAEAGLVMSQFPNLSSLQIIEIIKNSVDLDPSLAGKTVTGGKINFQKAMQLAGSY